MTNVERNRNRWHRKMGCLREKRNKLEYELRQVTVAHVHAKDKYLEWAIKASEEPEESDE